MRNEKDAGGGYPSLENVENSTSLPQSQFPPAGAAAVLSTEKQIEELARAMCRLSGNLKCSECSEHCFFKDYAKKAFNSGWRKQVSGEWIGIEYDGYADGVPVYDVWECSSCGNEWRGDSTPCYCPDCGAKMEGGCS